MTMNTISIENKWRTWKRYFFSTLATGFGMWIIGGIYHNLILPTLNEKIQPHHEGLGITLLAYLILAFLMTYLYSVTKPEQDSLYKGTRLGIVVGILWVLPHGLAMAGTHQTSIVYELKNTLYHVIEQGIGGMIVFYVFTFSFGKKSSLWVRD